MPKHIKTVITRLHMTAAHQGPRPAPPPGKLAILKAEHPPLHFYRYLYSQVGHDYHWVSRLGLDDAQLTAILHDDLTALYVLYLDGVPAGFAEIDWHRKPSAIISFFGLMPEFMGRGLGAFFLHQILELIWAEHPDRVLLETCTLDHPRALGLYQRFGFEPYAQENATLTLPDPED